MATNDGEGLEFIDEHSILVRADRDETWRALLRIVRTDLTGASWFVRALGVWPAETRGDWSSDPSGATLPGFAVSEVVAPTWLDLRGRHRFARYALVFELDEAGAGCTTVRARTFAVFPGIAGRAYRALVIGSRAHRWIVRRLLRRLARSAGAPKASTPGYFDGA
ncbi:hypothetical protein AKJ09_06481 [Labilithrix luteola]|uniref:DUF2867 domain-containing protein n=2 Tax=Labilithrix luteola TaxID=1391654 RepID=A0A0K1Q263_9BACT|nr:hypothetical protein AKJ09_06481 [Labilithrix luteola]